MRAKPDVAKFQKKAREADIKAAQVEEGSLDSADWKHIANSWRLLAERVIVERTGGAVSERALAKKPSKKPMRYQQSFYSMH